LLSISISELESNRFIVPCGGGKRKRGKGSVPFTNTKKKVARCRFDSLRKGREFGNPSFYMREGGGRKERKESHFSESDELRKKVARPVPFL